MRSGLPSDPAERLRVARRLACLYHGISADAVNWQATTLEISEASDGQITIVGKLVLLGYVDRVTCEVKFHG